DADTGGATGDQDAAHRVVPAVAGVGVVPFVGHADSGERHADRGGVIAGAEDDRFDPRAGGGDALAVGQALRGFDLDLETDLVGDADVLLDLPEQGCDDVDVFEAVDLWDDDEIEAIAGGFDDVD